MDTDRRHPLVRFDAEPLRPFIKDRRVLKAKLYPGGRSNSNYRVTLSDGTVFAAKFYGAAKPPGEAAALGLAAGLIPVPAILYEGECYIALSVVPGEPLECCPQYCALAARTLARLAAIKFPTPGALNKNGKITPWDFGGGQTDFTAFMLAHPAVCARLGADRVKRVKAILAREKDRLTLLAETPAAGAW